MMVPAPGRFSITIGWPSDLRSSSPRSEEHTSELQSRLQLVCRLLLEKKKLKKCSSKIITIIISFISGRLATKSNQVKQLIRNGISASLQRTFKKSFTSFSHRTRNKTRDGLIRVRNITALNARFHTSITHGYSIVIGSKHITLFVYGCGVLPDSQSFPPRPSSD